MVPRMMLGATGHDGNMSQVRIAKELEELCLNASTVSSPACDRSAQGISLSTPILMMTFGVVGNVLALIVLYSSRREVHARRTVFFVMLAGLAWTDLIGQFAVSPIAIITYANNLRWVGGTELCRYHGFMMVSFGLVMPLIVCCMSVERLLAIKFSYYYAKHVTRRKAQITFVASWGATCLFTALPFLGFGSYELQYPGTWCFLNFHRQSKVDTIYAAMFSSFNIMAILIMILCNLIVAGALFRMRRSRQLHNSPSIDRRLSASGVGSTSASGAIIRARRHSDMEAQMIWFLCLITVAFSVCWLPLNVHILLMQFTGTTNHVLDLKVIRMASCNQILDPWLYVIFRKNSLLRIVRRLKSCLSVIREVPRKGNINVPNMRYIISNKSYTYEATTLGKTILGGNCCFISPSTKGNLVQRDWMEGNRNNCKACGSESAFQLVSVCSFCDQQSKNNNSSNPLAETLPGLSPFCPDCKEFSCDKLESIVKSDTDQSIDRPIQSEVNYQEKQHGVSDPLLAVNVIPKKTRKKLWRNLDISLSSDSNGAYYSLDSEHKPSTTGGTQFKPQKTLSTDITVKKTPFLGQSKCSSNAQTLLEYTHPDRPQSLSFLNNQNFHFLPIYTGANQVITSKHESESMTPESEKVTPLSYSAGIPDRHVQTRYDHKIIEESNAAIQQYKQLSTVSPCSSDITTFWPKKVTDSPFLHSSDDLYLYTTDTYRGSHLNATIRKSENIKPSSSHGAVTNFPGDDFHNLVPTKRCSCPLKSRPTTFPIKLLSTSKAKLNNRNSVSIVGAKLGSSSSILHCVDHSDHIKCFRARKTPLFLGKSGPSTCLEGLKIPGNSYDNGLLEFSVGSCP